MHDLAQEMRRLDASDIGKRVDKRLIEFRAVQNKTTKQWFYEMCFCLLAANAKSRTAWNVQKALGVTGCCTASFEEIRDTILREKHRFHNVKAQRIVEARKHIGIKSIIQQLVDEEGLFAAREYLVKEVKGFGYKEASHYLRNVGYFDLAILDRHVLRLLYDHGALSELPTSLNRKRYLFVEQKFLSFCKEMHMSPAKVDFFFWYLRAGDVLK